jgi:hypothetical protein
VFWKAGHVLGWLDGATSPNGAPTSTADGGEYAEPNFGFLTNRNPPLGALQRPHGVEMILLQLAILASATERLRMARWAYEQSAASSRAIGIDLSAGTADGQRSSLEAYLGNYESAVSAALIGTCAMALFEQSPTFDNWTSKSESSISEECGSISVPRKRAIQLHMVFSGVVWPIFVNLLVTEKGGSEAVRSLNDAERFIVSRSSDFMDIGYWVRILERMKLAFTPTTKKSAIDELLASVEPDDTFQRVVLYLALSKASDVRPATAASAQAAVFVFGDSIHSPGDFVWKSLARWIIQFWRLESDERSFRLSSPLLLRQEFQSMPSTLQAVPAAARVLLAAEMATGATYDHAIHEKLRQLATSLPT